MSLYSSNFLKNVSTHLQVKGEDTPDIQFYEKGYLFLASEEGAETLRENHSLQKDLGAAVELLDPEDLRRHFPWMNIDGVKLASLGM